MKKVEKGRNLMGKSKLTLFIFAALILGVLFGWLLPDIAVQLKPLADLFLKMIKMIIAPLLFATLVVGIAGHGSSKGLGKIGLKTIVYFEIVTTIALIIGLVTANYFQIGKGFALQASQQGLDDLNKLAASATHHGGHGMKTFAQPETFLDVVKHFMHMLVDMVPTSVIEAMANGNILQIVVFAVFFALALSAVGEKGRPVIKWLNSLAEVMFKFTEYVMFFAPMGVFAAIATTIGQNGIGIIAEYAKLIGVLYFALIVFVVSVLVVVCSIVKIPFFTLIKAIKEPAVLAFSTASSEAALPKAMEIMEKFGVPKRIVSFVMPTGYTFNLDGSTLYLSLATIFVANLSGVELSVGQQIMIMLALMLTSKGIAAVPRVSLVVLTGTLMSFNIPIAGVAVLLGIDQLLDMGRTTVNLVGNCVATVVVSRWEGCFNFDRMKAFAVNEDHTLEAEFEEFKLKVDNEQIKPIAKQISSPEETEHINTH